MAPALFVAVSGTSLTTCRVSNWPGIVGPERSAFDDHQLSELDCRPHMKNATRFGLSCTLADYAVGPEAEIEYPLRPWLFMTYNARSARASKASAVVSSPES